MFKDPQKIVSLGLPEECYNQIKELAKDTCRTVPSYIRMIVYTYLRRLDRPDTKQETGGWFDNCPLIRHLLRKCHLPPEGKAIKTAPEEIL